MTSWRRTARTRELERLDAAASDPGCRRHRICHEWRRGTHTPGRLRGLSVKADFNCEIHGNGSLLPPRPGAGTGAGMPVTVPSTTDDRQGVPGRPRLLKIHPKNSWLIEV